MKPIIRILFFIFPYFAYASVSDGTYVGLEAGATNQIVTFVPNSFNLNTNGSNLTNSTLGFLTRFNLGYNFNNFNGLELGTTYNFGTGHNYPNNQGTLTTTAITLDGSYLLYLPTIVDKWSVFGRVGFAYDWINSNSGGCGCNNSISNPTGSSFADILGAGLMYRITPHASFRIEWISNGLIFPVGINNSTNSIANWTNQTFQLGLNYHF